MAKPPDERVSLHQLDPVKALKALLAVKPEPATGDEPRDDERTRQAPGGADAREKQ